MSPRSALVGEATFLRSFFRHYFREGFFGLIFASETILCQKVSKKGSEKRPKSAAKLCSFTALFQKVRTLCQKVRTLGSKWCQRSHYATILLPFWLRFNTNIPKNVTSSGKQSRTFIQNFGAFFKIGERFVLFFHYICVDFVCRIQPTREWPSLISPLGGYLYTH